MQSSMNLDGNSAGQSLRYHWHLHVFFSSLKFQAVSISRKDLRLLSDSCSVWWHASFPNWQACETWSSIQSRESSCFVPGPRGGFNSLFSNGSWSLAQPRIPDKTFSICIPIGASEKQDTALWHGMEFSVPPFLSSGWVQKRYRYYLARLFVVPSDFWVAIDPTHETVLWFHFSAIRLTDFTPYMETCSLQNQWCTVAANFGIQYPYGRAPRTQSGSLSALYGARSTIGFFGQEPVVTCCD